VVHLLKGLDDVGELGREDEVFVVLLAEQKEQHQGLQLLPVLFSHLTHHMGKSFILGCDGLVLLDEYLHHVLEFLVLGSQQSDLLFEPLLPPRQRHHLSLTLLPRSLTLDLQQRLPW
jgi:hypothetical protein